MELLEASWGFFKASRKPLKALEGLSWAPRGPHKDLLGALGSSWEILSCSRSLLESLLLVLRASWVSLGAPWGGVLGRSWGALGPSLEGLGALLGRLERVLGCSWGLLGSLGTVLAAHEAINGSFRVVLEYKTLIQFIDSIH